MLLPDSKHVFSMTFPAANNFDPYIEDIKEGYLIYFENIYKNVDIKYHLFDQSIKEEIILKNSRCQENFDVDLVLKNCSIFEDKSGRFSIVGSDNTELFAFDELTVIYDDHNKDYDLRRCAKIKYNKENNKLTYEFNKNLLKNKYPVRVDPSFTFNAKKQFQYFFLRNNLSQHNIMFVTGTTNLSKFIESQRLTSDDVVFQKDISVVFNGNLVDSIMIAIKQGSYYKKLEFKDFETTTSGTFSYINTTLPVDVSSRVQLTGVVKFSSDVYGEARIAFEREFSYVGDINIAGNYEDAIFTNTETNTFPIEITNYGDFKPYKYYAAPFFFNSTNDLRIKDAKDFNSVIKKSNNPNSTTTTSVVDVKFKSIPKPVVRNTNIFSSRSTDVDIETIINSMPGVASSAKIRVVDPWEFWLVYANINYLNTNDDPFYQGYIFIKNNNKFSKNIFIYELPSNLSFRFEWNPDINVIGLDETPNTTLRLWNFWRDFYDNSSSRNIGGTDADYYSTTTSFSQKLKTHSVSSAFSFRNTGFTIDPDYRHYIYKKSTGNNEYVKFKIEFNISGSDYIDIALVVENNSQKKLLKFGCDHLFSPRSAQDFFPQYVNGENNLSDKFNESDWDYLRLSPFVEPFWRYATPGGIKIGSFQTEFDSRPYWNQDNLILYLPSKTVPNKNDINPSLSSIPSNSGDTTWQGDNRFINSENDPRWYTISSKYDVRYREPDANTDINQNHWPFFDVEKKDSSNGNIINNYWNNDNNLLMAPFFVATSNEISNSMRSVVAFIGENTYALKYTELKQTIDNVLTDNVWRFGIAPLTGIDEIPVGETKKTRVRMIFDQIIDINNNVNNKSSWYLQTFKDGMIDFDTTTTASSYLLEALPNRSESFKNNFCVALESAINNRSNIDYGFTFKKPYKFISSNDFEFFVSESDGTVFNDNIILNKDNFDLYMVQKTSVFYLRKFPRDFITTQNTSGVQKYTSISLKDNSVTDNYLDQRFANDYEVNISDTVTEKWFLDSLGGGVFKNSYFVFDDNGIIRFIRVINNSRSNVDIEGYWKTKIDAVDYFCLIHYLPDSISLISSNDNYKKINSELYAQYINNQGNIVYRPIKIRVQNNQPTTIRASIIDKNKKFGGINKNVIISGGTTFSYKKELFNKYTLEAYLVRTNDDDVINMDTSVFISLNVGVDFGKIVIPRVIKDSYILFIVKTNQKAKNVKLVVNRTTGTSVKIDSFSTSSDSGQFRILFDPRQYRYNNLTVEFDTVIESSSALLSDALRKIDTVELIGIQTGIDVINDVFLKAGDLKPYGSTFGRKDDEFVMTGFDTYKYTPINAREHRLVIKNKNEDFYNNALIS
ncbi:MAG: hypothetical protein Q7R95_07055, partial [bacterium]|nr:hypothetical protein [bacterium]